MIPIQQRFRQFLPIVIDIETAGVTAHTDALLEICAIVVNQDKHGRWCKGQQLHHHIEPFVGANLDKKSLEFNGIDPFHPFRQAKPEMVVLSDLFQLVKAELKQHKCSKAVLVGHNAWFDLLFLKSAWQRCQLKSPFHSFTSFDTATLAGLFYGETVLAKACKKAKVSFNTNHAHSAIYDAHKTAELFCTMLNQFDHEQ